MRGKFHCLKILLLIRSNRNVLDGFHYDEIAEIIDVIVMLCARTKRMCVCNNELVCNFAKQCDLLSHARPAPFPFPLFLFPNLEGKIDR